MWNNHPMRTAGLKNKSPLQLYTQGIMEAQRAGWSILHADEEAIDLHARLRSFADHGIGPDYASMERESHPDDPHVEIPALENEIPPVLLDQTVQTELRARVGTLWPPPPDMGVDVFRRTLILVKVLLRSPMGHAHQV
ncbi:hypothetical protein OC845_006793 [Tilletia horrida]|nr:hypothetical protein OC845_006793 [Tilletia horrida]